MNHFLFGTTPADAWNIIVDLLVKLFSEGVQNPLEIILCCHRSFPVPDFLWPETNSVSGRVRRWRVLPIEETNSR